MGPSLVSVSIIYIMTKSDLERRDVCLLVCLSLHLTLQCPEMRAQAWNLEAEVKQRPWRLRTDLASRVFISHPSFQHVLYVWMFGLHVNLCTSCMPATLRSQNMESNPMGLDLQMIVSLHVGAGS